MTDQDRYIATFTPEAWINDYAVAVDVEGENTWDCTDYLLAQTDFPYREEILDKIDRDGDAVDSDDWFVFDTAAPALVREHKGPFTIRITKKETP